MLNPKLVCVTPDSKHIVKDCYPCSPDCLPEQGDKCSPTCYPYCNPDCSPERDETCSPTCWPYCNPDCKPEDWER